MKIKILRVISLLTVICIMFCYMTPLQLSAEITPPDAENDMPEVQELYSSLRNEPLILEKGDVMWFEIFGYDDGEEYEAGDTPFELLISDESAACVNAVNGCMIGVEGISAGSTFLNVKAPDGRELDIEIQVYGKPEDSYTPCMDYAPAMEYDRSPMKSGETRAVRVYNPGTGKTGKLSVTVNQPENCSADHEEGSDTIYLSALREGRIDIYVFESTCAFPGHITLEVLNECYEEESATTEPAATTVSKTEPTIDISGKTGDINKDGTVNVADLVKLRQMLNKKAAYNSAADINRDGTVNVFDMVLLRRIILDSV